MFKFPFGTMNELNLDWIITKVRELTDKAGITKEKITFETPNGDVQFDGSEAVTIDVQGVDTSGKLDKYTGGTDSIYGTLGSNQVNFPVPLPAERGGTGVTSLPDLETSMNLTGKYVGRKTTAGGLYAYGHNGSTEQEIPVEISPAPAGIPYRDANSCVKTGTPQADNDAATKKYVDDADADKLDKLTTANESVYSHSGNTQGEIATASANTGDTIVKRDGSGRAQFSNPSAAQDAVTKAYMEANATLGQNILIKQYGNYIADNVTPQSFDLTEIWGLSEKTIYQMWVQMVLVNSNGVFDVVDYVVARFYSPTPPVPYFIEKTNETGTTNITLSLDSDNHLILTGPAGNMGTLYRSIALIHAI